MTGLGDALGLDAQQQADLRLAVSEACTNVVMHAYEGRPVGLMEINASVDGHLLHVTASDRGPGVVPRPDSPGLGLGLPIISTVSDRFEVREGGDRAAAVRMTFVLGVDG